MPGLLTRWDPYGELAELRSRFDRMFDELSPDTGWRWTAAIDVERADGDLIVRADVPGFKPEEINIEVEADMLTISGKHEESKEEKGKHYLRHERRYGSSHARSRYRKALMPSKISAQTHDGVLEVKVPLPEQKCRAQEGDDHTRGGLSRAGPPAPVSARAAPGGPAGPTGRTRGAAMSASSEGGGCTGSRP